MRFLILCLLPIFSSPTLANNYLFPRNNSNSLALSGLGIAECSLRQFKCLNKKCVQLTWMCDSEDDCGDNSDETAPECTGAPKRKMKTEKSVFADTVFAGSIKPLTVTMCKTAESEACAPVISPIFPKALALKSIKYLPLASLLTNSVGNGDVLMKERNERRKRDENSEENLHPPESGKQKPSWVKDSRSALRNVVDDVTLDLSELGIQKELAKASLLTGILANSRSSVDDAYQPESGPLNSMHSKRPYKESVAPNTVNSVRQFSQKSDVQANLFTGVLGTGRRKRDVNSNVDSFVKVYPPDTGRQKPMMSEWLYNKRPYGTWIKDPQSTMNTVSAVSQYNQPTLELSELETQKETSKAYLNLVQKMGELVEAEKEKVKAEVGRIRLEEQRLEAERDRAIMETHKLEVEGEVLEARLMSGAARTAR